MKQESGRHEIQALYLELIRRTKFNAFDGEKVAHDLVDHKNLWRSAAMWSYDSLITLRDLEDGYHNADTLYIVAAPGKERELEKLAHGWDADTVSYLGEDEAQRLMGTSEDVSVLQCWWD